MDSNTPKFLDKKIMYEVTYSLEREVNELRECLKSEGVDLTKNDILRAYDIFLRIIGIGRNAGIKNTDEVFSIFTMFGFVTLDDFSKDIESDEEKLNTAKQCYRIYHEYLDKEWEETNKIEYGEKNKDTFAFSNIDMITDNIYILFKEFVIFSNEIIRTILKEINSGKYTSVSFMLNLDHSADIDFERGIGFICSTYFEDRILGIALVSTALVDLYPGSTTIVNDTFSEEEFKIISSYGCNRIEKEGSDNG